MSDGKQERQVESMPAGLPEPQPNAAIGILRFFIWLMPTAIVAGCFFLLIWIDNSVTNSQLWTAITVFFGFACCVFCSWLDSVFALPCRLGKRHRGLHMIIYILAQKLLVVPTFLAAIIYAICSF